jgi:hypothetical protein
MRNDFGKINFPITDNQPKKRSNMAKAKKKVVKKKATKKKK